MIDKYIYFIYNVLGMLIIRPQITMQQILWEER